MTPTWLTNILRLIRPEIPKDFVGQVEVNVFKGGISNVNVRQSFKEEPVGALDLTSKQSFKQEEKAK